VAVVCTRSISISKASPWNEGGAVDPEEILLGGLTLRKDEIPELAEGVVLTEGAMTTVGEGAGDLSLGESWVGVTRGDC
jgi:hypothetical protein